jgi:hypothetical protein
MNSIILLLAQSSQIKGDADEAFVQSRSFDRFANHHRGWCS